MLPGPAPPPSRLIPGVITPAVTILVEIRLVVVVLVVIVYVLVVDVDVAVAPRFFFIRKWK
jgi:hypothetical protein